ncbi:hypothetical protein [Streptomyces sp. SID161]|uniref:hypothetical protein n=1 Tax=Streptomyces sp. SID161 TaxID=2690251 RepID=UPI001370C561|nr:hypothetical protein [Streptomyces sp. SID161]MYW46434.1 hypothetical protein [Streptomyces sp. SID161]
MIHEVDEALRRLLDESGLAASGVEIVFDAPTSDWAAPPASGAAVLLLAPGPGVPSAPGHALAPAPGRSLTPAPGRSLAPALGLALIPVRAGGGCLHRRTPESERMEDTASYTPATPSATRSQV